MIGGFLGGLKQGEGELTAERNQGGSAKLFDTIPAHIGARQSCTPLIVSPKTSKSGHLAARSPFSQGRAYLRARQHGIVNGYNSGLFGPGNTIPRYVVPA